MRFIFLIICLVNAHHYKNSNSDVREHSICPSERCWKATSETSECTLKVSQNCLSLLCLKERILVSFPSALFAESDDLVFDNESFNPVFDTETSVWSISCKIGECGMTARTIVENGQSFVVFGLEITADVGLVGLLGLVGLNGLTYSTRSRNARVTVSCRYSSNVNIGSSSYMVKSPLVKETLSNVGDLSSGFALDLFTDDSFGDEAKVNLTTEVLIGQMIYAEIKWSVGSSASSLVEFYLSSCVIVGGGMTLIDGVRVVDDNCYARVLDAQMLQDEWIVDERTRFTFRTFTTSTKTTVESLRLSCTVKICVKTEDACRINRSVNDCPHTKAAYDYTPNGRKYARAKEVTDVTTSGSAQSPWTVKAFDKYGQIRLYKITKKFVYDFEKWQKEQKDK